jgi:hypothetical protein
MEEDKPLQENNPEKDNKSHTVENNQQQKEISSSAENVLPETEEPKTDNIQPETEKYMEVHHHTHAPHGKKNWKNYFWEFLMLFLAVFCGFLAEYQLEHKIERDREKVYINNLYEDLKDDIVHFSEYDKTTSELLVTIDSMILLMKSPDKDLHINRIYYLARKATMNPQNFFSFNSRTYEQMKNSGHLRLIRNQQVADSISGYYFSQQMIELQNNILKDRITDYMQVIGKVLDAQVLFQIFKDKKEPTNNSLKFISNNPQEINMFLTSSQYYYGARKLQNERCNERSKKAQRLLDLIKKEYHLK